MSSSGHASAVVVGGRFELARGVWFARHEHPVPQLAWASRGVLSVRAVGRTWVLPPGLALWIPAGLSHETGAATAADMLGLYIRPRGCPIRWTEPTVVAIDALSRELLTYLLRDDVAAADRRSAASLLFAQLRPVRDVHIDVPMPTDSRAAALAGALVTDPTDGGSLEAWGRERRRPAGRLPHAECIRGRVPARDRGTAGQLLRRRRLRFRCRTRMRR